MHVFFIYMDLLCGNMLLLLSLLPVAEAADLCKKPVRNAECRVYCMRGGWDSGFYSQKEESCFCLDKVDYVSTQEKRLTVPKMMLQTQPNE